MRRISLLWKVVRITHAERFAVGYVLLLFLVAVAVWLAEPSITTLADSLWYCFAASTTIGFGDFVAVTWGGRILTVLLALYGIFVVALVPGVMVNYFIEFNKIRYNESLVLYKRQVAHVLGQYISQVFVMKIPMKGNGRRCGLGREDFPLQLHGQIHEGRIFFSFRRACLHEVCRLFQLGECFPEGHQQLMIYRARFSRQFFLYVFPALGVNHVELCQQFIVFM